MSDSITLKEHFEAILSERDKAISAALASQEKAATINKDEVQRWRDNANEWRGAMNDRERDFLTRREFYIMIATAVTVVGAIFAFRS
jgi:hypothetical protein